MARLIIKFVPLNNVSLNVIEKHYIQALIYESLKDTPYDTLHTLKTYKFFTFSDIFPPCDFKIDKEYSFFISSPDKLLLKYIHDNLNSTIKIGPLSVKIKNKTIKRILPKRVKFITASPIIAMVKGKYLSFHHGTNLKMFLDELKKNAIDKYNSFYNDEFYLEGELFDKLIFKKSVSIRMRFGNKEANFIGSMWRLLEKKQIDKSERKFYNFLFDAGVGEKNSLGFGALNEHPYLLIKNRN